MFKRFVKGLSVLLVCVLCVGMCSIEASADTKDSTSFSVDGITYRIIKEATSDKSGNVAIALYKDAKSRTEVLIPETVKNGEFTYNIKEIDNGAFAGCTYLESVTVPNGCKSIGSASFYGCKGLKSVTISRTVEEIGDYAFDGCTGIESMAVSLVNTKYKMKENILYNKSLTEVVSAPYVSGNVLLQPTVKKIHNGAFAHNTSVTTVTLQDECTEIGEYAFYGCSSLRRVDLCNTAMIGEGAFRESGITELVLPKTLNKIEGNPFIFCEKLESVSVSNKNKSYSSLNNIIYSKDKKVLIFALETGKSFTVDKAVEEIEAYAFAGNKVLTELTVPKSVKIIHKGAFYNCTSLKKIHFASVKVSFPDDVTEETLGHETYKCGVFFNIKSKPVIEVPYNKNSSKFESQLKDNVPRSAKIVSF